MKNIFCSVMIILIFAFTLPQVVLAEKTSIGFVDTADSSLNVPDFIKMNLKEALRQGFVDAGKFEIVDRNEQDLKKLFEEMKFSGERVAMVDVNDQKKAEYGKIAGMEYMVIININDFYTGFQSSKFQTTSPEGRFVTRVGANLRLINSSTGKVILEKSVTVKKSIDAKSASTQEFSINKEENKTDSQTGPVEKIKDANGGRVWQINTELANKVIKSLADKIVRKIVDELYPIKILVRSGSSVSLNRGRDNGIKVGDEMSVFTVKKVMDDDTEDILDLLHPVGKIKITSVSEKTAEAEITEDSGVAKDCTARLQEAEEAVTVDSIKFGGEDW